MGDFYQNGLVTTLHDFKHRDEHDLENELVEFSKDRPMALIIPSLYSELEGKALKGILYELAKVPYLNEIVIGLDKANKQQFQHAKKYFSRLPQHHRIIWNDGPRLKALHKLLKNEKIAPTQLGKGRNVWYCSGYLIASGKSEAIALHDADILTYNKSLLNRLFYPVVNPNFHYRFCKGYYFRADENTLKGRAVRLFFKPLIRTLMQFFGPTETLQYFDSFRYPFAGEFSMRSDVMRNIRIPCDWGLEIGILSEVHRNHSFNRICQVEIADRYDHKHQQVSVSDPNKGLNKMTYDIALDLYIKLAQDGIVFSIDKFRSIRSSFLRIAFDFIERYQNDAIMNGYSYDRHSEEKIVNLFSVNVFKAGKDFLKNPDHPIFIPNWKRVMSAIPDFLEKFYEAVELDNK